MLEFVTRVKRALRPTDQWSLDVDLRYLPAVRELQKSRTGSILEVGSSSYGITPYVKNTVIGCDTTFPGDHDARLLPVICRGSLPFRDGCFDAAVSMDTLEHVPRDARAGFVSELLRVSRSRVIIGFPEGGEAAHHDSVMEAYYRRHHADVHPYFVEHREFGVPLPGEFLEYVRAAGEIPGKTILVERRKNVSLFIRSLFMRLIWHRHPLFHSLYHAFSGIARLGGIFDIGRCYRAIYFIRRITPGDGGNP